MEVRRKGGEGTKVLGDEHEARVGGERSRDRERLRGAIERAATHERGDPAQRLVYERQVAECATGAHAPRAHTACAHPRDEGRSGGGRVGSLGFERGALSRRAAACARGGGGGRGAAEVEVLVLHCGELFDVVDGGGELCERVEEGDELVARDRGGEQLEREQQQLECCAQAEHGHLGVEWGGSAR